jgi:hypothetical protein
MRRKLPLVIASGGVCAALVVGPGVAANASPSSTSSTSSTATRAPASAPVPATGVAALPDTPQSYAAATFEAWLRGDDAELSELAAPEVATFLAARRSGDPVGWHDPVCEGAAGSTYCTWARSGGQLTIQVGNEAASQGQPRAVTHVEFGVTGDNVAFWPFTTAEEARNTQVEVDQGSSPWMLEPAAVVASYAQADLGWVDASVEQVGPSAYWVTDQASGTVAQVEVAQPVRQGEGGIWAVTAVGSMPLV